MIRSTIETVHKCSDGAEFSNVDEAMEYQRKLDYALWLRQIVEGSMFDEGGKKEFSPAAVLDNVRGVYDLLGRYISEVHSYELDKTV